MNSVPQERVHCKKSKKSADERQCRELTDGDLLYFRRNSNGIKGVSMVFV